MKTEYGSSCFDLLDIPSQQKYSDLLVKPVPSRQLTVDRPSSVQCELDKLRPMEAESRASWLRDEQEVLQSLPPRAWPPRQPTKTDIPELQASLLDKRCPQAGVQMSKDCEQLTFDLATALVFNDLEPQTGFASYYRLGKTGHLDGMVAAGVCLTEGLGVERNDDEGVTFFKEAANLGSAQAAYELATLNFTGDAGLEEDERAAFLLFEQAAAQKHVGAMFMVADCLLDGVGCDADSDRSRAVGLLFAAAQNGHCQARHYMMRLWDGKWCSQTR